LIERARPGKPARFGPRHERCGADWQLIYLFGLTIFLSSALLFLVEPMIARMLLPMLGGTPAVWNTCMVFFQATLFAGYLYTHATTRWLKPRTQAAVHATLWLLSIATLPIALSVNAVPTVGSPILWLFGALSTSVGMPFFLLSTTSPMLQQWLGTDRRQPAANPYVLYAAGNVASLMALLSYPLIFEQRLRLGEQRLIWAIGYAALAILTVACAAVMTRGASRTVATPSAERDPKQEGDLGGGTMPSATDRLRWVALAFIPSSLVLAVTTYLTTDIAAVPLLWVLPLALYLLTFVLVFGSRAVVSPRPPVRAFSVVLLPIVILIRLNILLPAAIQVPAHLLVFFLAAMVCHRELWQRRPGPAHLTEFYVWLSLGGVLGGLFTTLAAPLMFTSIVEYPLLLVLACLVRPASLFTGVRQRILDVAIPAALGVAILLGCRILGSRNNVAMVLIVVLLAVLVVFGSRRRPWRFALGVAAVLVSLQLYTPGNAHVIYRGRSFFGAFRLLQNDTLHERVFIHGATVHGGQSLEPGRRAEPMAYYTRSSPIGQVFEAFSGDRAKSNVGIVGLGVGTLAAFGETPQRWTFFEIDPAVERLARDARYFTYLADARAKVRVVLGDARISLRAEPGGELGLLVLDAFSGDSIPVHLVTREALRLYLEKLDDHGVLVFHVSNRYMDLRPVLDALAKDANLVALTEDDLVVSDDALRGGKLPSRWVAMARSAEDLAPIARDPRWRALSTDKPLGVWTDDFSNLFALLTWHVT
jgi:hypothetical protein